MAALADALTSRAADGWLAGKFAALPADDRDALAAHLAGAGASGDRAARWVWQASAAHVVEAFSWCALDGTVPVADRPELALRVAGTFAGRTRDWWTKVAGAHPAVPAPADVCAGAGVDPDRWRSAGRSVPAAAAYLAGAGGLSAHDAAMFLPHPVTDPPPAAGLADWLIGVRLPKARAGELLPRLATAAGAWSAIGGETNPPAGLADALRRTRAVGVPFAADSVLAPAFMGAGAGVEDWQGTFGVYLDSFSCPCPPLPSGSWSSGRLTGRFVDRSDPAGLMAGEAVNCCQHIGGVAESSVRHGQTSPQGGFFVVTDDRGTVVAQSWVWADSAGRWCFDNIETVDKDVTAERAADVAAVYRGAGQAVADQFGATVTVGATYTKKPLRRAFPKADPDGYTHVGDLPEGTYTDADDKQRLVATPAAGAVTVVPVGAGRWQIGAGGPVMSLVRGWHAGADHPYTAVTVDRAVDDDMWGRIVELAADASGADQMVVSAPGREPETFPAAGPAMRALVGWAATTDAANRTSPDAARLLNVGRTQMVEHGLTADQIDRLALTGVQLGDAAWFLADGHTYDQTLVLAAIGANRDDARRFLSDPNRTVDEAIGLAAAGANLGTAGRFLDETGRTYTEAVELAKAGTDLGAAAWFLSDPNRTCDEALTLAKAGANLDSARWFLDDTRRTYSEAVELAKAGADLDAARRFLNDPGRTYTEALELAKAGANLDAARLFLEDPNRTYTEALGLAKAGANLGAARKFLNDPNRTYTEALGLAKAGASFYAAREFLAADGRTYTEALGLAKAGADLADALELLDDPNRTYTEAVELAKAGANLFSAGEFLADPNRTYDEALGLAKAGANLFSAGRFLAADPNRTYGEAIGLAKVGGDLYAAGRFLAADPNRTYGEAIGLAKAGANLEAAYWLLADPNRTYTEAVELAKAGANLADARRFLAVPGRTYTEVLGLAEAGADLAGAGLLLATPGCTYDEVLALAKAAADLQAARAFLAGPGRTCGEAVELARAGADLQVAARLLNAGASLTDITLLAATGVDLDQAGRLLALGYTPTQLATATDPLPSPAQAATNWWTARHTPAPKRTLTCTRAHPATPRPVPAR